MFKKGVIKESQTHWSADAILVLKYQLKGNKMIFVVFIAL
jgi:hypothetical protein